jgi:uncharacterized protein YfdQ (DUF2303 family)
MLDATAIKEIADLGREATSHVVPLVDGRSILVIPEGCKTEKIEAVNPVLTDHIRQAVRLESAASFVAYVNDFKTANSRLFVSAGGQRMTAELDYHAAPGTAAQRGHRADWSMPLSEEWKRWTAIDGQPQPQQKFAEFIEENLEDVREPEGAKLLEIATYLQAKKKVTFESGLRLSDGNVQLTYKEDSEHSTRGNLAVPTEIKLGIPVFFGGAPYAVRAFLRWRISDEGKLAFTVVLHRRQMILQDAVQEAAKVVSEQTGLPALFGGPA